MKEYQKREDKPCDYEFHTGGLCVKGSSMFDAKILLLKRADSREILPGKYSTCGGRVEVNETVHNALIRHFRSELGMKVMPYTEVSSLYVIDMGSKVINGVYVPCRHVQWEPDIELYWHTCSDARWFSLSELGRITADLLTISHQDISNLIRRYLRLLAPPRSRKP